MTNIAQNPSMEPDALDAVDSALRAIASLTPEQVEYLAMVGHDLRAPLTAVLGLSTLARDHWEDMPEWQRRDLLDRVVGAAEDLQHLLQDVFSTWSLQAGRFSIQPRRFNLGKLVRDMTHRYSDTEHVGRINLSIAPRLPAAFGDPLRQQQIFANLLSNASRFSPDEDAIDVEVTPRADELVVSVRDRGIGVSAHELDMLFKKFTPLSAHARNGTGSGLGLHICKTLVEAQGGSIWVEHPADGGALFAYTVPMHRARRG